MCSARNFHPEWGYFAPAPSFVRIVQIVLVATAVGAAAGASVVFSLVGRPATETSEIPVAARTLAWPVRDASAPLSAPQAAQVSAQAAIQNQPAKPSVANAHGKLITANKSSSTGSIAQPPAATAALTEVLARANAVLAKAAYVTTPAASAAPATDPAPVQKRVTKKRHFTSRYASRDGPPELLVGEYYDKTSGYRHWGNY